MMNLPEVPVLIGAEWSVPPAQQWARVYNPSRGEAWARVPLCDAAAVDAAVRVAAAAFPGWAATPIIERARVMFRYRALLLEHRDELACLITREHGKTRSEARASLHRGIEVVEFAAGIPALYAGQSLENIAGDVDCRSERHPLGVCAGITPFNFPAMVPLWMFPIALTCGNAFILKPSERVPMTAVRLVELLLEAGLPTGVIQLVHGGREVVEAIVDHPGIAAVSFVGSTSVARCVYSRGAGAGKRVQAAGGAKNHLFVLPDADLDQALDAVSTAAFGCAGERCMAGSVAVPVGNIGDDFVELLASRANELTYGPTDEGQQVDMGPLISGEHRQRVVSYLQSAPAHGAVLSADGRPTAEPEGFLLGASVVDQVRPGTPLANEEVFGPVLAVIRATTLEEALTLGASCPHGNGGSIFTRDGWSAREFARRYNAGMIGINVGVPAPMAWFPFTGWNQSFFGDLHVQGSEGIQFYTRQKVVMSRWFPPSGSAAGPDPLWRSR